MKIENLVKKIENKKLKKGRKRDFIDRDECTIFSCHIHPAVDDKDIFEFFSQCGPVRDILLMRDNKSGTSKGYGYIEFHDKESVVNALTTNGQYLGGSPIMVSVSNAEKNRAAASSRATNNIDGPFRLYVSNIDASISADDL
ncbi:RNA-binding protein 39, partial [Bonamia ostreae]